MDSNATQCLITPNPDISGIGVRISIYIQAFVALLSAVLAVCPDVIAHMKETKGKPNWAQLAFGNTPRSDTLMDWTGLQDVLNPNLILGFALLIASIIQARSAGLGLTVYHSLIILNLNWIIALCAVQCFTLAKTEPFSVALLHRLSRKYIIHITHLTFTAAFGLWLFATVNHFDRTGTDCTHSTVYYTFGKHVIADNPTFRRFWLAIYSILAIPTFNTLFVSVVLNAMFLAAMIFLLPILSLSAAIGSLSQAYTNSARPFVMIVVVLLIQVFPLTLMVVLTEKTIGINSVGAGEGVWSFGQTAAVLIAVPPSWKVALQAKEAYSSMSRDIAIILADLAKEKRATSTASQLPITTS